MIEQILRIFGRTTGGNRRYLLQIHICKVYLSSLKGIVSGPALNLTRLGMFPELLWGLRQPHQPQQNRLGEV